MFYFTYNNYHYVKTLVLNIFGDKENLYSDSYKLGDFY